MCAARIANLTGIEPHGTENIEVRVAARAGSDDHTVNKLHHDMNKAVRSAPR